MDGGGKEARVCKGGKENTNSITKSFPGQRESWNSRPESVACCPMSPVAERVEMNPSARLGGMTGEWRTRSRRRRTKDAGRNDDEGEGIAARL